jgi:hypothetical protein
MLFNAIPTPKAEFSFDDDSVSFVNDEPQQWNKEQSTPALKPYNLSGAADENHKNLN